MKTLTILMLGVVALGGLSACQVTARDKDTSISVNNNEDGYHHPRHCPPGHAKKGWC